MVWWFNMVTLKHTPITPSGPANLTAHTIAGRKKKSLNSNKKWLFRLGFHTVAKHSTLNLNGHALKKKKIECLEFSMNLE